MQPSISEVGRMALTYVCVHGHKPLLSRELRHSDQSVREEGGKSRCDYSYLQIFSH